MRNPFRILTSRRRQPVLRAGTLHIDAFRNARVVNDRMAQLLECVSQAPAGGLFCEFGVFKGDSLNAIARRIAPASIYGFDSFEGLPMAWSRDKEGLDTYAKGHFAVNEMPRFEENAVPVRGWIEDTVPTFLEVHPGKASLLHIDVDLYSSTKVILTAFNDRIVPGTIIVFDELSDFQNTPTYTNWEAHEWLALQEWMEVHQRAIRPLSRTKHWSAALVVET